MLIGVSLYFLRKRANKMEKTIEIDGKKVKLKSTAGTPKRYKAQFRKDYFSELLKLSKLMAGNEVEEFDLAKID